MLPYVIVYTLIVIAVFASASFRQSQCDNTPDIAIVDFMLGDGFATALAEDLNRRVIPFVIYSGYPQSQAVPPELQDVPWLEKPTSREDLMQVVLKTLMGVSGQMPSSPKLHSYSNGGSDRANAPTLSLCSRSASRHE